MMNRRNFIRLSAFTLAGFLLNDCRAMMAGGCVYCGACLPCPAGIDIPRVNMLYDKAIEGDSSAAAAYSVLGVHASSCLGCGVCESRCPHGVSVRSLMQQTANYFGQ